MKEIKNINLEVLKENFHGVTGSGNKSVLKIVQKTETGMQCLICSRNYLTKDWVTEIRNDFGICPHIFHFLKVKRAKIWKSVVSEKTVLIVGTRSALFLPFKNLGLIVVDEEQDQFTNKKIKLFLIREISPRKSKKF